MFNQGPGDCTEIGWCGKEESSDEGTEIDWGTHPISNMRSVWRNWRNFHDGVSVIQKHGYMKIIIMIITNFIYIEP